MVRAAMTFAMVKFGQNYMARLVDFFDRTERRSRCRNTCWRLARACCRN